MLNVQKNVASKMQSLATDVLSIRNRLAVLVQMYAAENMAALSDADYAALPELAHVTVTEMTGAKNALDALLTAIGDYSVGTNATKLVKIVASIPE